MAVAQTARGSNRSGAEVSAAIEHAAAQLALILIPIALQFDTLFQVRNV
jgi:hypothetical protein